MHRKSLLFAYVCFFATAALAQDARIRQVELIVEQAITEQRLAGVSVAIVSGEFRWSRGFGFADLENHVPATADSSYRMASVSKPMTAVAILKLADEGKLDLDADVHQYVSYFPRKKHPVTTRHLLGHLAGISHYRDYQKEGRIKDPKTTREAVAIFADWDLESEPGTKYTYSSYGYNLLGAVVEEVSQQPYATYMNENVWKPLGMTATVMDDPRAIVPHRVQGYVLEDGVLRRSEYVDISSRFGGGGTRSNVKDMVRLFEGLLDGKVLKGPTRAAAWTAQATLDGKLTGYGFGFGVDQRKGQTVIAHTGSQQETRTSLLMIPSARLIVALATNSEHAALRPVMDKIVDVFY